MQSARITDILNQIQNVRIAVYGDFCLDAYLIMDPRGSEISLETGLKAEAVHQHYYSPGGASNIAANLVALKPADVLSIGVIGDDIYGRELKMQLEALDINTSFLITQKDNFDTYVFTKRIMEEEEGPRIDFGTYNQRSSETDQKLLQGIKYALDNFDVLIFNQQVPWSITNEAFIDAVNKLFIEYNEKIVLLDSRHYNKRFRNVCRKVNDIELVRLSENNDKTQTELNLREIKGYLQKIYYGKPIFVTCGERGIMTIDDEGVYHIPGLHLMTKLDTVGAGDTTISALALCLGAGISPKEAAVFANFAAAVTVQKLFITGTANGREILEIGEDPDFIFNVDRANNVNVAEYVRGTDIEICNSGILHKTAQIKHVVFDHDGTLSTLRRGWDVVMKNMMIESITGKKDLDKKRIEKIEKRVDDYIKQSTGVQTIVQMDMLVHLVKEFKIVAEERILDKSEYKNIYLVKLLKIVRERIKAIQIDPALKEKYTIQYFREILEGLKIRGIKMYLASGTDVQDVIDEAQILGYADFFEERIYGSVDDLKKFSKKLLIESIIQENQLKAYEFAVIGDGPVEIREGKKMQGIAIGVASNEEFGYGLNISKRKQLIKAGADLIIPDYCNSVQLLTFLFGT
jgi:rfaE bifunctional protein kinase chain/domain